MQNLTTKKMATIGMIAAIYTVLSISLAPITFGPVQLRVAEALTLLPVFGGLPTVWAITLGCAITNIFGAISGINILGPIDIVVGTTATLIAGLLTYLLRNVTIKGIPFAAALPPILVNAVIIGLEHMYALSNGLNLAVFWTNFLSVFVGQFLACFVLGLILLKVLKKTGLYKKFIL